jgi:tetratricopeptide (TPR) repeat protein
MLNINRQLSRRREKRILIGFTILVLVLSVVSGCAPGGAPKPVSKTLESMSTEAAVSERAVVRRLADGREGFAIVEKPSLEGGARKDFERAVAFLNEGELPQAIQLLETVIEKYPGLTAPHINIALAFARSGKTEQAEKHLKKALNLVPGHPVASNEYGLLLRKAGRFAEARTTYEKAITAFPEYLPAHKNLGILCDLYLKDLECAIEQYEIYSEAMPEDEQIKIWIADLRMRLGDQ